MIGVIGFQERLMMFSSSQIEAAAKAWLEWQFDGRKWEDAPLEMRERFMEGAREVLAAAENAI